MHGVLFSSWIERIIQLCLCTYSAPRPTMPYSWQSRSAVNPALCVLHGIVSHKIVMFMLSNGESWISHSLHNQLHAVRNCFESFKWISCLWGTLHFWRPKSLSSWLWNRYSNSRRWEIQLTAWQSSFPSQELVALLSSDIHSVFRNIVLIKLVSQVFNTLLIFVS